MPHKRSKKKKQKATAEQSTVLAPLTDNNDVTTDDLPIPSNNEIKMKAPTPIIILSESLYACFTHKTLVETIKQNTTDFVMKLTKNHTNLQINDKSAKNSFLKELQEKGISYHTYREVEHKTHAFVLRGLEKKPPPKISDIKEELNKLNVSTKEIYKMRSPYHNLYLVTTDTTHTVDSMQKIQTLMNSNVQWKRHVNKKVISQCHTCQIWGHTASNCSRKPQCLKCAEDHHTKECTKPSNTPATCANCKGDHPANYSKCPVYLAKLKMGGRPKDRDNTLH